MLLHVARRRQHPGIGGYCFEPPGCARGRPPVTPIYSQRDAIAALDAFRAVDYELLARANARRACALLERGHLLGSASIELEFAGEGKDGKPLRVLVSGDLGPDAKLLQPDPEAPTGSTT